MTTKIINGVEFIDSEEFSRITGYGIQHARRLAREGKVPAQKFLGIGRWLYNKKAILALMPGNNNENKEAGSVEGNVNNASSGEKGLLDL